MGNGKEYLKNFIGGEDITTIKTDQNFITSLKVRVSTLFFSQDKL